MSKPADEAKAPGLPRKISQAALKVGLPPDKVADWAVRPNGTIVLLASNGMKFILPRR